MGFFSWKTADSGESISNRFSVHGAKPVYLLQPNGAPSIKEPSYEGHGYFGGVDAYKWLAENNLDPLFLIQLNEEDTASAGAAIEFGRCFSDQQGNLHHMFHYGFMSQLIPRIIFHPENYADPIFQGKSANDLIASGEWIGIKISDLVEVKYRLKFSFDPDARYEDLPASSRCPVQGFFYESDDEAEFIYPPMRL